MYRCSNTSCEDHNASYPEKTAFSAFKGKCINCDSPFELIATSLNDLGKSVEFIPANLCIIPHLQRLLHDPNSSRTEIAKLVSADQSIVSYIIQVSNSVHFAGGHEDSSASIEEAIQTIGYENANKIISSIASASITKDEAFRMNKVYGVSARDSLTEVLFIANFLSIMAQYHAHKFLPYEHVPLEDIAYTIGLVHNIGRQLINYHHERKGIPTLKKYELPLIEKDEEKILGYSSVDAGVMLLEKWHFPSSVIVPVKYQDIPDATPIKEDKAMSTVLNFAKKHYTSCRVMESEQLVKTHCMSMNLPENIVRIGYNREEVFESSLRAKKEVKDLLKAIQI
jgi:HD-like signal output (HDOD) protein